MLNISGINAQIIYNSNTAIKVARKNFLKELGKELVIRHMVKRSRIPTLSITMRQKISMFLPPTTSATDKNFPTTSEGKPHCIFCPKRKNRFTSHQCNSCAKHICKEHTGETIYCCQECIKSQYLSK